MCRHSPSSRAHFLVLSGARIAPPVAGSAPACSRHFTHPLTLGLVCWGAGAVLPVLCTLVLCVGAVLPVLRMHAGVDMLVDVHGDEELPYCFIAGSEGIPGWNERMKLMQVCIMCVWAGAQTGAL